MSLGPGTRLGPYEIVSPLGAGGMGEVYKARDPRLGRDVAVKVIPVAFASDPERLQRFEQEARAAAALNHPNILAVFDIGQHDGAPYIVSELLEGETLREKIVGLSVRKAIDYAIQIAQGLAAAHEKGIVHRDLKPENLFVTADGRVKILDFGLAKLTQAEPAFVGSALPTTPPNTLPGVVLGTIGYMSPEQVRGLAADHRSDIFAFGAILYEMLSSQRAFGGDTAIDRMMAIAKEAPPELPVDARHIPPALERTVDRCLEKNPANRFQSAVDLVFALQMFTMQSDAAAPMRVLRARTRLLTDVRVAWAIVAMLLVAVAALSVLLLYLGQEPTIGQPIQLMVVPPDGGLFVDDGTSSGDPMMQFALSPDGRSLAFIASTADGRPRLWVRSLDASVARPLPDTDGAAQPFWSPDSRFIGFFAGARLKKIEARGGPVQVVSSVAVDFRGGTWNRDDVILFSPNALSGLSRVPATGGVPQPVTTLNAARQELSHRWPQFLPDGRHFLYFVRSAQPTHVGAYIGSLDSSESIRVVNTDFRAAFAAGFLLFVREGTLFAQSFDARSFRTTGTTIPVAEHVGSNTGTQEASFSASEHHVVFASSLTVPSSQLTWVDRGGRILGTIGAPGTLSTPALSPDGRRVAVSRPRGDGADLWLVDAASGAESRATFDPSRNTAPVWSADGSRLFFASTRDGVATLYQKPVNGTSQEERLLGAIGAGDVPSNASVDGKFLIFGSNASGGLTTWALRLVGARTPIVFAETPFFQTQGQLSPDDRWIAYTTDEAGGAAEVFVQPFPASGVKYQISTSGGADPKWRRDGKELFYVAADGKLMAVSVLADATTFAAGVPQPLFDLHSPSAFNRLRGTNYAPSPDGQRFLVNRIVSDIPRTPMTMMLNWTEALKK
jgi:eukaryotic-like serine/threonine-protein kinase